MRATRKPQLTRRRVIAGAVVLVLVLAVAVAGFVFGVFDATGPVKATFVRFEKSDDGTTTLAMLKLTNEAQQTFTLLKDPSDKAFTLLSKSGTVVGEIRYASGELEERVKVVSTNLVLLMLGPGSNATYRVQLPQKGEVVHLAVFYLAPHRRVPRVLEPMQRLCWQVFGTDFAKWAICDQEIQCPLLRPDGTVEPPRLVPKGECKSP